LHFDISLYKPTADLLRTPQSTSNLSETHLHCFICNFRKLRKRFSFLIL